MIEPTLYIIMRSDIPDMNPGKACAQAAHAQADFDNWAHEILSRPLKHTQSDDIVRWKEDRTFGRTIVLYAPKETIVGMCWTNINMGSGITVDPTYPWKNWYGDLFVTDEITCGWVFLTDAWADANPSLYELLKSLPLMR